MPLQGIQVQPSSATQLQQLVLEGNWSGALELLPKLTPNDDIARDVRWSWWWSCN
jgi:hypothetical protein